MTNCPRCEHTLTGGPSVCPLCGLALDAPFDPTAGHPDGARYIGRLIGTHFKALAILASGGHGMVLLVRHTKLRHRNIFALKLLRPELSRDTDFRQRFLREAEIVYTFSHPNIVPIREFAETPEGELFFTMDFCRGVTLDRAMQTGPPFTLARVLAITDGILQGLEYAHGHDIVHRDLKPANVFLEQSRQGETARLLDFGIAKPTHPGGLELTGGQKILGTPAYMAPEQIMGRKLDCRTDLYALGVVLYRLLSGKAPFKGSTGHEILAGHLRDTPSPLARVCPHVPLDLSELVLQLLAKKPEERPRSAAEIRTRLASLAAMDEGGAATVLVQPMTAGRRRRRRLILGGLAVVCLAAAAGVAVHLSGRAPGAAPRRGTGGSSGAKQDGTPVGAPPTGESPPRAVEAPEPVAARNDVHGAPRTDPPPDPVEPDPPPVLTKWCGLCARAYPEDCATCPDCGGFLVTRTEEAD